ncbi:hypothetical protein Xazr_04585 [Xanthomonas campestris pv. azadirachtae]|nr:hypothetical protein Xazr_04585 [Xanthomonas campestris pv. azadirachtae]
MRMACRCAVCFSVFICAHTPVKTRHTREILIGIIAIPNVISIVERNFIQGSVAIAEIKRMTEPIDSFDQSITGIHEFHIECWRYA